MDWASIIVAVGAFFTGVFFGVMLMAVVSYKKCG